MNSHSLILASAPRAPRYGSYPTAPHFTDALGADTHARWLKAVPPGLASVYVHIPFCTSLCWFCICRTQGVSRAEPVRRYLAHLEQEISHVGAHLPQGVVVGRMHWGGGSPSILSAAQITALFARLRGSFTLAPGAEFIVEIDPRDATDARLDALAAGGLTRGAMTAIDCNQGVQRAINRMQDWAQIQSAAKALRIRGAAVDIDALYGLPLQTEASLRRTMQRIIDLSPDQIALYGYVHAPWIAQRQRAILADALPGAAARKTQADLARKMLIGAGYLPIGIDHFARPGSGLAVAAASGGLRRGFQGYVADPSEMQIGLGASAISRFPGGYLQNACATASYTAAIAAGTLATTRGKALSLEDRVRGHVIERLLCSFSFDAQDIIAQFGDFARPCLDIADALLAGEGHFWLSPMPGGGFSIQPDARAWTRLIASRFDAYMSGTDARCSRLI